MGVFDLETLLLHLTDWACNRELAAHANQNEPGGPSIDGTAQTDPPVRSGSALNGTVHPNGVHVPSRPSRQRRLMKVEAALQGCTGGGPMQHARAAAIVSGNRGSTPLG